MAEKKKKAEKYEKEKPDEEQTPGEEQKEDSPSVLEWIFAGIGLLVVICAVGFLIYRGATKGDAPPQVKIEVESVAQTGEHYTVSFRVSNTGDTTAAALTIEGELKTGEKSEETSDVTLTYLPAQSVRRGSLFFTKNPNEYEFKIRPKGFEKP